MRPSNRKTAAFAEMHRTIYRWSRASASGLDPEAVHSIVVVDVPDQKLFDG